MGEKGQFFCQLLIESQLINAEEGIMETENHLWKAKSNKITDTNQQWMLKLVGWKYNDK